MKYCPNCGKSGVEGMKFCPQCGQRLTGFGLEEEQRSAHQPEALIEERSWFERHLNWTWFFAYLTWFLLNASYIPILEITGLIILLFVSGWVIKQKGRSLWWILLTPIFSPLWLGNRKTQAFPNQEPTKLPMQKARTRAGRVVQIIGGVLWLGCGLASCILIFGIIADAVGTWVAIIGFIFFPALFAFTPLIHWLITGIFPWLYLVLWLIGWGGALIYYLGSRITGEE